MAQNHHEPIQTLGKHPYQKHTRKRKSRNFGMKESLSCPSERAKRSPTPLVGRSEQSDLRHGKPNQILYKGEQPMYLQTKHKEFAIRCYAQFMTRSQVAEAFIKEFPHDLPKPEHRPKEPTIEIVDATIEEQFNKDEYAAMTFKQISTKYQNLYGVNADAKLEQDMPKIQQQIEDEYSTVLENQRQRQHKNNMEIYEKQLAEYQKKVKAIVSNQLRRYNITDTQFPKKYLKLFNQTRLEYLTTRYEIEERKAGDNITSELETLYGYIKQNIFKTRNQKEAATYINQAITVLKLMQQSQ